MKLVPKRLESSNEYFHIQKKDIPCLDSSWHYHPQYELIYISVSSGIRFVGDSVSHFEPGEFVLVGPYLPHLWRNDPSYYTNEESEDNDKSENKEQKEVSTIVIKFTKDFIGNELFNRIEFIKINELLEKAKYGLSFPTQVSNKLSKLLINFIDLSPTKQIISLLDILNELSLAEATVLSSSDMRQYTQKNAHRTDKVLKYISDNYASELTLDDISDVANMQTTSFCRFFKQITNLSFVQYLAEVRIQNAKRLLAQENYSINEVCDYVGFQTISNFNKQFKRITRTTPSQFREELKNK